MNTTTIHPRIQAFRKQFGMAHWHLALHAALPLSLTSDLLYRIWANFQRDEQGQTLDIPWVAVADVLLSLCEEVGHDLYEMDRTIRAELLHQLQTDLRFGEPRLRELSDFLLTYIQQRLNSSDDLDTYDLAQTQRWTALVYVQPEQAAHELAKTLAGLSLQDGQDWLRLTRLIEQMADPLQGYEPLLTYTQSMSTFVNGEVETARQQLRQILDPQYSVQVAGVDLPIPAELKPSRTSISRLKIGIKQKRISTLIGLGIIGTGLVFIIAWQSLAPLLSAFLKLPTENVSTNDIASPFQGPISEQMAIDLVDAFLEAKRVMFAPPYNAEPAAKLLTGQLYIDITKLGGSIDWLRNNNAYYQFGVQQIDSVQGFAANGNQATIEVTVTEDRTLYINGRRDASQSGFETTVARYTLVSENGWKISDYTLRDDLEGLSPPALTPYPEISVPSQSSISYQDAIDLIDAWLQAKRVMFAPPYSDAPAAELTTGQLYTDITKPNGSIDWIRNNNAYYQFGVQQIDSVQRFAANGNQATIELTITEDRTLYVNGRRDARQSGFETTVARYTLVSENGTWKISDYTVMD